jgi:hypothetical protein
MRKNFVNSSGESFLGYSYALVPDFDMQIPPRHLARYLDFGSLLTVLHRVSNEIIHHDAHQFRVGLEAYMVSLQADGHLAAPGLSGRISNCRSDYLFGKIGKHLLVDGKTFTLCTTQLIETEGYFMPVLQRTTNARKDWRHFSRDSSDISVLYHHELHEGTGDRALQLMSYKSQDFLIVLKRLLCLLPASGQFGGVACDQVGHRVE